MPDPVDAPCQLLEWDSRFFGRRIGRVQGRRLTVAGMPALEAWCREQRLDCLYLLADADHAETARLAADHHFQYVDARVTLETEMLPALGAATEQPADDLVRLGVPGDLPVLRPLARRLHRDSRFFFDNHFDPALSERMFEVWLEKSFEKPAGCVLVAEWQGRPAGYLACHLPQPDTGQMDLLGVDESAQGRGLGGRLIAAAQRWFAARSVRRVLVVTQGRNLRAQRLYQRAGFVTRSMELWYHRWFQTSIPDRTP